MKAWRSEYLLRKSALPAKGFTPFWDEASNLVRKAEDMRVKLLWESKVPGSGAPEHLIVGAVQAAWNRGYDVRAAEKLLSRGFKALKSNDISSLRRISAEIFYALSVAPKRKNDAYFRFSHPETFKEIAADFPEMHFPKVRFSKAHIEAGKKSLEERVCGGWYGQIAGASMGTRIEGYRHKALVRVFGDKLGTYIEKPDGYNDDITYEIAFLDALKEKGKKVTAAEIALKWAEEIPFGWSAEQVALDNIRKGIMPPQSALLQNPFGEWIGAAMRGMAPGLVAAGNPKKAAYLAYIDGTISHYANGLYGEIFIAVLTSLAFVIDNPQKLLISAIKFIPRESQLYTIVWEIMGELAYAKSEKTMIRFAEKRFKTYNWIHLYPNLVSVISALYFSQGSFDRAMNIVAQFGFDADCNGGMVGAVLGVIRGFTGISEEWTAPFNGKIKTYMFGKEELSIDALCKDTLKLSGINFAQT